MCPAPIQWLAPTLPKLSMRSRPVTDAITTGSACEADNKSGGSLNASISTFPNPMVSCEHLTKTKEVTLTPSIFVFIASTAIVDVGERSKTSPFDPFELCCAVHTASNTFNSGRTTFAAAGCFLKSTGDVTPAASIR